MRPLPRVSRKALVVLIGALVALTVGVGFAVASIPDSSGVFHACYKKHNGQLGSSNRRRAADRARHRPRGARPARRGLRAHRAPASWPEAREASSRPGTTAPVAAA